MDREPDLFHVEAAIGKVLADVERSRNLVHEAMAHLLASFGDLRVHLADERAMYEAAIQAIMGAGADANASANPDGGGLVGIIREVLRRFVGDIVQISAASAKILLEVETLRGHATQVAARGDRIQKIAQTTRVISLNARIEAQRAGSAGSVFRVIADQIKVLANESAELSKAIREAIALQASSLQETHKAASDLASADLNVAVDSHERLEDTIAKLTHVSRTSMSSLDRIQRDIDSAIQALQFEDMLDQLLGAVAMKLTAIQATCGELARGTANVATLDDLRRSVDRDAVTQRDVSAGNIELF